MNVGELKALLALLADEMEVMIDPWPESFGTMSPDPTMVFDAYFSIVEAAGEGEFPACVILMPTPVPDEEVTEGHPNMPPCHVLPQSFFDELHTPDQPERQPGSTPFLDQADKTLSLIAEVKRLMQKTGATSGQRPCPVCPNGIVRYSKALNGHTRGACTTSGCAQWIE